MMTNGRNHLRACFDSYSIDRFKFDGKSHVMIPSHETHVTSIEVTSMQNYLLENACRYISCRHVSRN